MRCDSEKIKGADIITWRVSGILAVAFAFLMFWFCLIDAISLIAWCSTRVLLSLECDYAEYIAVFYTYLSYQVAWFDDCDDSIIARTN